MEETTSASASTSASTSGAAPPSYDAVVRNLGKRGWSLGKLDDVVALVTIQRALLDDADDVVAVTDAVELELLNTDLRSFGAKSLPDPNSLRRLTHLVGPKILQANIQVFCFPLIFLSLPPLRKEIVR